MFVFADGIGTFKLGREADLSVKKMSPKLPWVRITEATRMLLPVRYAAATDLLIFQVGAFQQVLILGRLQCVDVQERLCMLVG